MKRIAILGSTGSIGTQTLDVVRANGDIEVVGIAAGRNIDALESQIREFSPKICGVWDEEKAKELAVRVKIQARRSSPAWKDFWRLRSWKDMRSS